MVLQNGELSTLARLGLTISQAKVYLALVRSGKSTAKTISDITKIARHDIYRVTHTLEELGFVERTISVPTEFTAIPIQAGFSMLQKSRDKETSELNAKIMESLQNFKENNTRKIIENKNPHFVLIPKKVALARKRENSIENAQTSVDVVTSWKRYSQATFDHLEVMRKASKRGVIIRHATEKPEDKRSLALARKIERLFNDCSSFKVKYIRTSIKAIVAVFDNKEVILITSPTLDLNQGPALWSDNPSLVQIAKKYFEMMWTESLQIKKEESISIPF